MVSFPDKSFQEKKASSCSCTTEGSGSVHRKRVDMDLRQAKYEAMSLLIVGSNIECC